MVINDTNVRRDETNGLKQLIIPNNYKETLSDFLSVSRSDGLLVSLILFLSCARVSTDTDALANAYVCKWADSKRLKG